LNATWCKETTGFTAASLLGKAIHRLFVADLVRVQQMAIAAKFSNGLFGLVPRCNEFSEPAAA
jgi:hypothetical protein